MRVINHNWSATKQRLHPRSVAEISRHSVLSGDRIRQCETSIIMLYYYYNLRSWLIRASTTLTKFFLQEEGICLYVDSFMCKYIHTVSVPLDAQFKTINHSPGDYFTHSDGTAEWWHTSEQNHRIVVVLVICDIQQLQ